MKVQMEINGKVGLFDPRNIKVEGMSILDLVTLARSLKKRVHDQELATKNNRATLEKHRKSINHVVTEVRRGGINI